MIFDRSLFGGSLRVRRGNVRVQRVPSATTVVVRQHVAGDASARRLRRQRGGGRDRGQFHADDIRLQGVPGVRGPQSVRCRPGQYTPRPAVYQQPGAPAQLGRRARAADQLRYDGTDLVRLPGHSRTHTGRGHCRTGRFRLRLRVSTQRFRRPSRLLGRQHRLRKRPPGVHRQGMWTTMWHLRYNNIIYISNIARSTHPPPHHPQSDYFILIL